MKLTGEEKKCLLIAPLSFYSYSEYLKNSLTQHGYNVTLANDEYPANGIGKIMGKFRMRLLLYLTLKKFERTFISGKNYDLVMIIKGRGVSAELIKKLKQKSSKVIGYTFDSLKYHSAPKKWFRHVDQFYTFDYLDGEKNGLRVVELFSSMPINNARKICKYQISAIARNHSDRLKYIDNVLSTIKVEEKFVYIFEQNIFTFLRNFFNDPKLYLKYKKYISFKALSFEDYAKVLQESDFVIDFAHPSQSGITIRCFEALSIGTKIITNNPFVFRYKHFNDTNTIVFNEKSDPKLFKARFNNIQNRYADKHDRNINEFIGDLVSEAS